MAAHYLSSVFTTLPALFLRLQSKMQSSPTSSPMSPGGLPSQEEVIKQTKPIARCIQELLSSAQEGKQDRFESWSYFIFPSSWNFVFRVEGICAMFQLLPVQRENLQSCHGHGCIIPRGEQTVYSVIHIFFSLMEDLSFFILKKCYGQIIAQFRVLEDKYIFRTSFGWVISNKWSAEIFSI